MGPVKTKAPKAEGGLKGRVARVRSGAAAIERVIALGIAHLILGSTFGWVLTVNVVRPLLLWRGHGFTTGAVGTSLLAALLDQAGFLLSLPLVAWAAGWIFEGRRWTLSLGAAFFAELWLTLVAYLAEGGAALVDRPLYRVARLALVLVAAWLGASAFAHARAFADARERSRRRLAPGAAASKPPPEPAAGSGTGPDVGATEAPAEAEGEDAEAPKAAAE